MRQRVHLPGLARLRVMGSALLVLSILLAGLAAPAPAWAQEGADPAPVDQSGEIVGPPLQLEPAPPVEPLPWEGPVETLEYVEPANPVEGATADAVWAGKTIRLAASDDTFIASNDPSDNFGGLSTMAVGWPNDRFGASRALIRFNVGPVPNRAKIYSARLNLFLDSGLPVNGPTMRLAGFLPTRGWGENSATWYNARDIGGSQWHLGDVNTQPGWKSFGLTSQVQNWVNGQTNNGLMIMGFEVAPNGRIFRTRHFGGSEPFLEINYECDTLPPVSQMRALPATSPGSFTVSWSGRDQAPSGCQPTGIRKFFVQYRVNGGGWVDWKSTTGTSATFDNLAPSDSWVEFRVFADDNAGNTERRPSNPQAATRVISQAPVVTMTPLPAITNAANFVINWVATSAPGGIASHDVQWQINNGGWADLLVGTTQTSFTVTGAQSEFTYAFRVRGRDRLGNVGSFPATPQAQTTVVLFPIARMTPFQPNIINSTSPVTTAFTLRWTGNTPPNTIITQYQIHFRVRNFAGGQVQPWTVWQTLDGSVTSASFPITLGNGIYEFEATATNNLGQTTPFAGKAEATMIVDLNDTIKPNEFMPVVMQK